MGGLASRSPLSPSRSSSPAGLSREVPGDAQGGREAGRSRRRRIRCRRRRRSAAPGGGSAALSPETGPAGSERRRPGSRSGRRTRRSGEGRTGGCARLAVPGRPTRTASRRRASPAAAPEEPATRRRWCAPRRQPPPRRPESPPRAGERCLPAPPAAKRHLRPQQVSPPRPTGRERARPGVGGRQPHPVLARWGPAGPQDPEPPSGAHTCCLGRGLQRRGPEGRRVRESRFPAPRPCSSLPPLLFGVDCHLYGVLGVAAARTPSAFGSSSTSANVTGIGKTKALPQGALAWRPRPPEGVQVAGGLRVGPQCPGPSRPGLTRARATNILGRKEEKHQTAPCPRDKDVALLWQEEEIDSICFPR